MIGTNTVDLLNRQLQIIDILCGETPKTRLADRIGSISVVYDYSDFAEEDQYIEVKKEYVDKLIAVFSGADIKCEYFVEIPKGVKLYRWREFPGHSKKRKWFSKSCDADEYAIIKTRLKRDKVYYLISDINEYEKRNVKVEAMVVDTREVD